MKAKVGGGGDDKLQNPNTKLQFPKRASSVKFWCLKIGIWILSFHPGRTLDTPAFTDTLRVPVRTEFPVLGFIERVLRQHLN